MVASDRLGLHVRGCGARRRFRARRIARKHPLLDVRLFGRPDFTIGSVGITFLFFSNFGFFFVAMQYMQLILGYTPLQTAWALGPLAVPIIALGATMHLILPKFGLRLVVAAGLFLIAAGLFSMQYFQADSSYIEIVWPIMITATGIGLSVAPTTSAIMNAVPTDKQGVASAVNDTTREVGAAVGIAVAGSVLAAQYSHALSPVLAQFPEQVRGAATDSLANALAIAKQLGPQGPALTKLAETAFLDAMDLSLVVLRRYSPSRPRSSQSGPRVATVVSSGSWPDWRVRQSTTNSAARCPSITIVAWGPRPVTVGSTEPSTTHSPSTPRTLHRSSTTAAASPSDPIGAVAHRCWDVDQVASPTLVDDEANSRASSAPALNIATSCGSLS